LTAILAGRYRVRNLANSERCPNGCKGNEFRAIRERRNTRQPLRKRARPVYGTAATP